MTTFQRLAVKIKEDTGIDAFGFKRLYPGYWQQRAGAWTWRATYTVYGKDHTVGSQWAAKELLIAPKLVASNDNAFDTDIFPD